jgi:hypothetical protein
MLRGPFWLPLYARRWRAWDTHHAYPNDTWNHWNAVTFWHVIAEYFDLCNFTIRVEWGKWAVVSMVGALFIVYCCCGTCHYVCDLWWNSRRVTHEVPSETGPWSVSPSSCRPEDSVVFASVPSGRLLLMVQDEELVCKSLYIPVQSQSQIDKTVKPSLEQWTHRSLFVVSSHTEHKWHFGVAGKVKNAVRFSSKDVCSTKRAYILWVST